MKRRHFLRTSGRLAAAASLWACSSTQRSQGAETADRRRAPAAGPLRVHPKNPRYFADPSGRAVYLTGSHTWPSLVDIGPGDPPPAFDFAAYLDFLERLGHNFIRLWTWEPVTWNTARNRRPGIHTAAPSRSPAPDPATHSTAGPSSTSASTTAATSTGFAVGYARRASGGCTSR